MNEIEQYKIEIKIIVDRKR